jgi:hypothetical protein
MEDSMPKREEAITKNSPETHSPTKHKNPQETVQETTHESTSYLKGLFTELHEQMHKYNALTGGLLSLEARIELAEKTLCLTRDHFAMTVARTQDALPNDWSKVLNGVRFVGIRLADACAKALQERGKMTPEQLLRELNNGMFRFRTNSPLREIHAALMRHPHVRKSGGNYVWVAPPTEKQLPMRLRVVEREIVRLDTPKEDAKKAD